MIRKFKLVALTALAVLVVAAAAQAATSHKVNMKVTKPCQPQGTHICATYGGKPFGTCKMNGKLVIPNTQQTWKCRAGSFKLVGHGTTGAANDAAGTWHIVKGSGTGKYKGITGKGTFSGKLSTGIFTYKGTVKY